MKKLHLIIFIFGLIAHATSIAIFAVGDSETQKSENQIVVVQPQDQQLVNVFNQALQNPEIRKQFTQLVKDVAQLPQEDRDLYQKVMQVTNVALAQQSLEILKNMNKKPETKSLWNNIISTTQSMIGKCVELGASSMLTMLFVVIVVKFSSSAIPFTASFLNNIVQRVFSNCPTWWDWWWNLGYCVPVK